MNNLKQEYAKRKRELRLYLKVLEIIDNRWFRTRTILKILKAVYFLLLYNIIESVIYNCLDVIIQELSEKNVKYSELNKKIKEVFIFYHYDLLVEKNRTKGYRHVKFLLESLSIDSVPNYKDLRFGISGNVDIAKINEIANKIGLSINSEHADGAGAKFKTILTYRNILGHGNIGFKDLGKDITIPDLKELSVVLKYLEDFISETELFISEKRYMSISR